MVFEVNGRRLSVCHLGKFYPPAVGGIETHLQTLARGQAALGADVRVVCVNHQDRHGRDVTWEPLGTTATVQERDGVVRLTRLGRRVSVARFDLCPELPALLHGLAKARVDMLHVHVPNPTMVLALALVRPRLPLVLSYHSDVVRQRALGLALRPFEHLVFRRAGRIMATSPLYAAGSDLLRHYREKLGVLPLGLELGAYLEPSAAALAQGRHFREQLGKPLWLTVGRLVYYKGIDTALAALPHVPGTLAVIGTGPLNADLKHKAKMLGIADRVHWLGRVTADELTGLYQAATALWLTSNARSEGFGLVQVEAMASGCPVINTAIPGSGVAWVSPHEETGLTVPVGDASALAEASRRLLNEPGLRDRLGAGGRRRAIHEFDQRLMAERSLTLYRTVLAGRP